MYLEATIAILLALLAYDFIYPRFIYDFRAKRAKCGPIAKRLSWPFGIGTARDYAKRAKCHEMLNLYIPPESRTTKLVQVNTFTIIDTAEPENIKAMLSTEFTNYDLGRRWDILSPILGDGIFTVHGAPWKVQRNLLRPIFTRERVSKLDMLHKHTRSLLNHLNSSEDYMDMQKIFFSLTLDTSLHFLFDIEHDSFDGSTALAHNKEGQISTTALVEALERTTAFLNVRKLLARISFIAYSPQFLRDLRTCRAFADAVVKKVLAEDSKGDSFIAQAAAVNTDTKFLRDQAFTMFLAGRSTTASSLTHLILDLSQHPEKWQKLRKAVIEEIGPNPEDLSFEKLKRCGYLTACLNESLRLYPTVPLNLRAATKDTTLPRGGGPDGKQPIFVPKGMSIQYNVYGLQRDPQYWGPDAAEFSPERWENLRPTPWTFLPFNGGPRTCLGQQFALNEIGFVMARLAQEFSRLEPSQAILNREYKFSYSVTMRVWPSVKVRFIK